MSEQAAGERLKAACDAAVAAVDLQPHYDKAGKKLKTFCNLGAQRIAAAMGETRLDDPKVAETADILHALLTRIARKVDARTAVLHALDGGLAFAAMTSKQLQDTNGHIAVIRPEAMQLSTTVKKDVPIVANIGVGNPDSPMVDHPTIKGIRTRKNWNCRVSSAFPMKAKGDPDYFII